MPLALITRPETASSNLARQLSAKGFSPIISPFFTVHPHPIATPPNLQAVLVTSGNALPSLQPSTTPLYAVGDSTAARAIAHGFENVSSAGADALALAGLISRSLSPAAGPLLLAAGARQGHTLADDLRSRGFRVLRRVCYEARPVRRFPPAASTAIQSGDLAAVLFLSAETASTFVRLLPPALKQPLASVIALAIGKTTADALGSLPWLRICRAQTPTLDDVLALL